jgi:hypothetical protein
MKNQGFILALILSMGLLFSCSGSEDDERVFNSPPVIAKPVFQGGDRVQALQAGDSIVIRSKLPFYIGDVQYGGIPLSSGLYSPDIPCDSAFQYQKMKLDWLTLIHSSDSTLILKVDSQVGLKPVIKVYAGLISPRRTKEGYRIVPTDNCISVTRASAKAE